MAVRKRPVPEHILEAQRQEYRRKRNKGWQPKGGTKPPAAPASPSPAKKKWV